MNITEAYKLIKLGKKLYCCNTKLTYSKYTTDGLEIFSAYDNGDTIHYVRSTHTFHGCEVESEWEEIIK